MASIEDQIAEAKRLAEKYNLNVVDVISESKSAKEPGRVGFNTMLKRIHKGEAQGILTWKLNRLARNPIDGGQISWMLQQNVIKHIQTFERDYNPSDNVLLMQVEFGMANQYVKDLSLDIRRGMRQKAERGWYPISGLPIGYTHNPKIVFGVNDEIVPNDEQFSILKKLWDLLLTGEYSIADIKKKGDSIGLRNKFKKTCSKNTYYYIFTNEFYSGYYRWRDKDGNLIRYKGRHKVMVSPIEFQKAQIIIHGRPNSMLKERKYDFPYRGIIKCGECGCTVTPDHKLQVICSNCKCKYSIKSKTACPQCKTEFAEMENPSIVDILYYHCTKSKGRCTQGSITKDLIETSIEEELKKISITKGFYSWALDGLKNGNENKEEAENLIRSLRKKVTEMENRISNLVNLRADGEIDAIQFNLSVLKTQKGIAAFEVEIEETKRQNIEWYDEKEKDYNFAFEALEKFKNGDDSVKTIIAKKLSSNLTLLNKKLDITTKESLLEVGKSYSVYSLKNDASNLI
ncbi:MAG: recombinase family protein [Sphingobacteriia bacterium]|nr:recombinase family protein [Sphingobacteriia bacterium]